MSMNEEFVVNLDEEAEFMAEETGCPISDVYKWLDAEEEYYRDHGMILEPGVNCTEEELRAAVTDPENNLVDLDVDDMVAYIVSATDLTKEAAYAMVDAEYKYEHMLGIAGDIIEGDVIVEEEPMDN